MASLTRRNRELLSLQKFEENRRKFMKYRIEYAGGKCCNFAHSRKDLLERLKLLKNETISDIRKLYKSGVSDSVMEKYERYITHVSK